MELVKIKVIEKLREKYEKEQPLETMTFSLDDINEIIHETTDLAVDRIIELIKK